jgi:hypothetical protein
VKAVEWCITFEFTGLRGFLRRSGGMTGYASTHDRGNWRNEMTDQQRQEFEAITRPVIDWLNANGNPHMAIMIDPTSAVLYGGEIAYTTDDYLRD